MNPEMERRVMPDIRPDARPDPRPDMQRAPVDEGVAEEMQRVLYEVKRIVVGQDRFLERVLVAMGVYNQKTSEVATVLGPVFANLLLADEINRAPAKVQSALLEVMEERHVTIAGQTHKVPEPFLVMATQNPIETEGTYPLPEAQVDRFMMKVLVGYPSEEEEFVIVERVTGMEQTVAAVTSTERLAELQRACRRVYVDPSLVQYAVRLVFATREPARYGLEDLTRLLAFGARPRAPIHLIEGAPALPCPRTRA